MSNKLKLSLFAVVALTGIASPAFAQSWEPATGSGNSLPTVYDLQGGKHRYVYGYYGPLFPPISSQDLGVRGAVNRKG
jgi:hypothetical protein